MGTYWLDAGGLFYCSFRDTGSSTLVGDSLICDVGRDGGQSLDGVSAGRRPGGGGEHGFGDGWEGKNLRGGAEFDSFAGHAVDHAGGFILGDGVGAAAQILP